ncbi:hypothetical protein [Actinokineospora cianjurensis]|uniref:Uncharacterized protein n=1 Tax=Actinokineospora cianjurensis TaxID=585224 RepID=A0A421B622_9PSEU|nr:hypothetical protein [Actinokineospora cianjurensis]RLK59936.1 hypothetical protein CLV68_0426 [Actinokineospora cianjurensis]
MSGTVDLRLLGEAEDIGRLLAVLHAAGIETAGNGRQYPNRGGFGVRVYVEARVAESGPITATAERTDDKPTRKPVQRRRRGELGPGGSR